MRTMTWIPAAVALAAGCAARAPHPTVDQDPRWTALRRDVPALLTRHGVPSVSIARVEGRRVVYAEAFGEQAPGRPATAGTLYNVASLTKPVSAEIILRLASAGRIGLDEPMAPTWLDPDLAADPRHGRLTARLALSHQSGLPNWRRETGGSLRFLRDPGEAFGYSGEGYEWVARFAERRTGQPFEALAELEVLAPAGLRDMAYTRRAWFEGRVAVPTARGGAPLPDGVAERAVASDLLHATALDYARFLVEVLRGERLNSEVARERARVQVSRRAALCPAGAEAGCPDEAGFGLGWEVYRFGEETYLMHTGKDPGLFAIATLNLRAGSGTVILTSGEDGALLVLPILERIGGNRPFVAFLRRLAGGGGGVRPRLAAAFLGAPLPSRWPGER